MSEFLRLEERLDGAAEAPPPTWITRRSGSGAPRSVPTSISQPSVLPPSIVRPFSLPWQVKGSAGGHGLPEGMVRGSPGTGWRGYVQLGAELFQPLDDGWSASAGMKTRSVRPEWPPRRR